MLARAAVLAALLALAAQRPASACPFSGVLRGEAPAGHPAARRLTTYTAPDVITDPTNSMVDSGGLTNQSNAGKYQGLVSLAAAMGEDMCYWSMQQLPAPPNPGVDGPYTITDADYAAIRQLGDQATQRFQAMVTPTGPVAWAGCGLGYNMVQKGCNSGNLTGALCTPSALAAAATTNQAWPLASIMLRINAANAQAADNLMVTWRTTQGGHLPAMTSQQVTNGWGSGGSIVAKVVPCAQLPSEIFTTPMVPSCAPNITQMVHYLNIWKGLCSVWYDAYYTTFSGSVPCLPKRTPSPPPPSPPPPSPPSPPPPLLKSAAPSLPPRALLAAVAAGVHVLLG